MALQVDPGTRVITITRNDLPILVAAGPGQVEVREFDLNQFHLDLRAWEVSVSGAAELRTHIHNTEQSFGGQTFARQVVMINGYTITFEDGAWAVQFEGANTNAADVVNYNSVQVRVGNSAGLIAAPAILRESELARKLQTNRAELSADGSQTIVYDDDGVTPLVTFNHPEPRIRIPV